MVKKNLAPEIVSLIHHVELNQSGWSKKAITQVLKGVMWKMRRPRTLAELVNDFKNEVGVDISASTMERYLEQLASNREVQQLPGPNFKLSEATYSELSKSIDEVSVEEAMCRESFMRSCGVHCSELSADVVWDGFISAIQSAVRVSGANLYNLITNGQLEQDVDWLSDFVHTFDRRYKPGLQSVVREFFECEGVACRNKILRMMNAYFFAESTQLSSDTLRSLEQDGKTRKINVVLDTNFIFSVLGLHENPADDAVQSLLDLAKQSSNQLAVKLYVLPGTLDEAKKVLIDQERRVHGIRVSRMMANVVKSQPLPGIARKFLEAASQVQGLTAEAYFKPYIEGLRHILHEKGIDVLEVHPSVYSKSQQVIDDILNEQSREEKELPEHKRKGYETLQHDIILWHTVNGRRSLTVDSPLNADYWAVTVDWRLIAFDRQKRYDNEINVPVVLHPSNLIQLIQFWVPRSRQLDEGLINSISLPVYFQAFDSEDEAVTIKVLGAISRYENVDDLPEKSIKVILTSQALRSKIRDSDASNDTVFELIRDELLTFHQNTVEKLGAVEEKVRLTEVELKLEREQRFKVEEAANEANKQAEDERRASSQELVSLKEKLEDSRKKEREQESLFKQEQLSAQTASTALYRQRFIFGGTVACGLVFYTTYPATFYLLTEKLVKPFDANLATYVGFGVAFCAALLFLKLITVLVAHRRELSDWAPFKLSKMVSHLGWGVFVLLGGSVLQSGFWDWFKVAFALPL